MEGFDLPCGAGRLALKRAPGTFPRALGFESLGTFIHKYKGPPYGRPLVFVAEMEGFEPPDGVARQLISRGVKRLKPLISPHKAA